MAFCPDKLSEINIKIANKYLKIWVISLTIVDKYNYFSDKMRCFTDKLHIKSIILLE